MFFKESSRFSDVVLYIFVVLVLFFIVNIFICQGMYRFFACNSVNSAGLVLDWIHSMECVNQESSRFWDVVLYLFFILVLFSIVNTFICQGMYIGFACKCWPRWFGSRLDPPHGVCSNKAWLKASIVKICIYREQCIMISWISSTS